MTCRNPHCNEYPYYGLAPHEHVRILPAVSATALAPTLETPRNFVADPFFPGSGV